MTNPNDPCWNCGKTPTRFCYCHDKPECEDCRKLNLADFKDHAEA